ncbi:uncharacterized protein [Hyperolius riggenbachi]|uniref:uncharacterized protein n=1 Tax=Hyperolius riggenbachi TaxID=752182 RepID=UPI0035A26FE2
MIAVQFALLLLLYGIVQSQERIYHVGCPRSWMVGVPEMVTVEAFGHEESFPVQVSLFSYPDKKVTYDSQQLQLSSANHHRGSLSLLIRPEDFPSGDEEEKFVYLVAESDGSIKEEKIVLTDHRKSLAASEAKPAFKKLKRDLKKQIEWSARNYRVDSVKQCCLNGSEHYGKHWQCNKGQAEIKKGRRMPCSQAFEVCCKQTKLFYEKKSSVGHTIMRPGYCIRAPQAWLVGEPHNVTVKDYELAGTYSVTISLLSYPDQNVTFDSQRLLLTNANGHQGYVTLLIKAEDLPRGRMEKFAYLEARFSDSVTKRKVLLMRQRGNYTLYNKRFWLWAGMRDNYLKALQDLEFDDDIWSDLDGRVKAQTDLNADNETLTDLDSGSHEEMENKIGTWSSLNIKIKAWINLQNNIEAWRDLESRNKAWTDLQRNMTALVEKYVDERVKRACWKAYQNYFLDWECLKWSLEQKENEAMLECCSYTREYFHNLVVTGHVSLTTGEYCNHHRY